MEEPSDFPALKMNTTQFAAETAWIVFIKKNKKTKTKKHPHLLTGVGDSIYDLIRKSVLLLPETIRQNVLLYSD